MSFMAGSLPLDSPLWFWKEPIIDFSFDSEPNLPENPKDLPNFSNQATENNENLLGFSNQLPENVRSSLVLHPFQADGFSAWGFEDEPLAVERPNFDCSLNFFNNENQNSQPMQNGEFENSESWDVNLAFGDPNLGSNQDESEGRKCCHIMREIVHTNGSDTTKLEIYGREFVVTHAVMQVQYGNGGIPSSQEQRLFEFTDMEQLKQFLLQYAQVRRGEGFVVIQDSLSSFYEALSTRMDGEPSSSSMSIPLSNETTSDNMAQGDTIQIPQSVNSTPVITLKSNIARQRERTGKLNLGDLANHFHLPITAAAEKLSICPTVLKKVCRRNGMPRWPHRKIKSIERSISNLEHTLLTENGDGAASIRAQIEKLRIQRAKVCAGHDEPT
ncbi:hypothetical protein AMTRI_Chr04g180780 [Amborella trichopoda]